MELGLIVCVLMLWVHSLQATFLSPEDLGTKGDLFSLYLKVITCCYAWHIPFLRSTLLRIHGRIGLLVLLLCVFANVGRTWPSIMYFGTFLGSWLKLSLASNVLSIISPDAINAFSGLCVRSVVCEYFGCIAIILHSESSILWICSLICLAAVFT